jgi:hypothetical protein
MELGNMRIPTGDHPEELEAARKRALEVAEAAERGEHDPAVIQEVIEALERSGDFGLAAREKVRLGRLKAKAAQGIHPPLVKPVSPPIMPPAVAAQNAARAEAFTAARVKIIDALNAGDLNAARAALTDADSDTRTLAGVEIARRELAKKEGR